MPRRLERKRNGAKRDLPARFLSKAKNSFERQETAKELDEENGLYYYGARYLDPKYSMWLSTDPALSDYMAGSSAGCGGIYNHINSNLYHYAGNNPVKYTDPDGKLIMMVAGCANAGAGTGGAVAGGVYVVIDGKGNVSIGMYVTTSVGAFASYGWSVGGEITIAPFATEFSDISGYSLSAGGSGPTPLGCNLGGEVGFNPNAEGPLAKLKSITITAAATRPGLPEGHIYNNYTVSLLEINLTKGKSNAVQQQIQTYLDNEDYEGLQKYVEEMSKEFNNE